jgi:hypothetical protein
MRPLLLRFVAIVLLALAQVAGPVALAQSTATTGAPSPPDKGGWMSSFLGAIGLSAPSISSVGPSNIAGALQSWSQFGGR